MHTLPPLHLIILFLYLTQKTLSKVPTGGAWGELPRITNLTEQDTRYGYTVMSAAHNNTGNNTSTANLSSDVRISAYTVHDNNTAFSPLNFTANCGESSTIDPVPKENAPHKWKNGRLFGYNTCVGGGVYYHWYVNVYPGCVCSFYSNSKCDEQTDNGTNTVISSVVAAPEAGVSSRKWFDEKSRLGWYQCVRFGNWDIWS
ncbi:unnamed protein product [Periconia digitata]|uniref:Uncharacterized protein n=1 Tax=Periconia digitata TaxID=1303443 RepID=A0A9W4U2G7_9PLEO|nr:unnamed protein product [Periconia digitata]